MLRSLISSQVREELLDSDTLEPEAQQQAMKAYRNRYGLATKEQLQNHCKKNGYRPEDLQRMSALQEKIRRCSKRRFSSKAESHYLTRKEQFDQVTYSQLTAPSQYLAQELFLRINEGEATFGELAKQLRHNGIQTGQGRFGPLPLAKVSSVLAKPLRASSPGSLLQPLQVKKNWLIVRLEDFQPSRFDAAMEQTMCVELFQLEVERIVDDRLGSLLSTCDDESDAATQS